MTQRKRWLKTREFEKGECVAVRRPGKAGTDRNAKRPPGGCVLGWVYFVRQSFTHMHGQCWTNGREPVHSPSRSEENGHVTGMADTLVCVGWVGVLCFVLCVGLFWLLSVLVVLLWVFLLFVDFAIQY